MNPQFNYAIRITDSESGNRYLTNPIPGQWTLLQVANHAHWSAIRFHLREWSWAILQNGLPISPEQTGAPR